MSLIHDINDEFFDLYGEHKRTAPKPRLYARSDGVAEPYEPSPPQTPMPTKLLVSYDVWDTLRAEANGDYPTTIDWMRMEFRGTCDIVLTHPDDIEAPGWRFE